ncbi:Uncharacterised protein [Segatella copri]|nr:Uncharacterised protein [Segatella copri]
MSRRDFMKFSSVMVHPIAPELKKAKRLSLLNFSDPL